jgi:hypothetical protein
MNFRMQNYTFVLFRHEGQFRITTRTSLYQVPELRKLHTIQKINHTNSTELTSATVK